jgi:hypothetical protein
VAAQARRRTDIKRNFVTAVTAAREVECHICLISQWRKAMSKPQTNAINTSATRKQLRESTDRELTKEELDQTIGGLSLNFTKVQVEYWR